MQSPVPTCHVCSIAMVAGFMPDLADYNVRTLAKWVPGIPKKSIWTGLKYPQESVMTIEAHRCPNCGRLELFAHPECD